MNSLKLPKLTDYLHASGRLDEAALDGLRFEYDKRLYHYGDHFKKPFEDSRLTLKDRAAELRNRGEVQEAEPGDRVPDSSGIGSEQCCRRGDPSVQFEPQSTDDVTQGVTEARRAYLCAGTGERSRAIMQTDCPI